MISSRMLFGQITSSPRAPAELSSLHSSNCSLLVLSFRSSPFRISNLEPLFVKHPGGGTPNLRARRYLPGAEGLRTAKLRGQDRGIVVGNRLNGNHRIHSRSTREGGAIHDI